MIQGINRQFEVLFYKLVMDKDKEKLVTQTYVLLHDNG